MVETLTVTIDVDGGAEDVTLPADLIDRLADPGESPAEVVADVVLVSFAGRAHALVHHAEGEPDDDLVDAEADVLARFEERFGMSYGEATGHSH